MYYHIWLNCSGILEFLACWFYWELSCWCWVVFNKTESFCYGNLKHHFQRILLEGFKRFEVSKWQYCSLV